MGKTFPPFVFVPVDGHGAQSNPAAPGIQKIPLCIEQCHLGPVKRLFSIAMGPPAPWMLHCDGVPAAHTASVSCIYTAFLRLQRRFLLHQTSLVIIKSNPDLILLISGIWTLCTAWQRFLSSFLNLFICHEVFHRHPKLQGHAVSVLLILLFRICYALTSRCPCLGNDYALVFPNLCYVNLFQPGLFPGKNGNLTEDTHIRQSRAPIPSKHTVGLAKMGKASHAVCGTACIDLLILRRNKPCGRSDLHPQFILALPGGLLYGKLPDPVHIIRMTDQRTIQINIRQRINPLKTKK